MRIIPAIPPEDYCGTMVDWIAALNERGFRGDDYINIEIEEDMYDEILDWCEGGQA